MEQETSDWIFEGMGLEYDQPYRKFLIDALFKPDVDHLLQIEFYVSVFFHHFHFEKTMLRDIHIVTNEGKKHD